MDTRQGFTPSSTANESQLAEIQSALKLVLQLGAVAELRVLEAAINQNYRTTCSGYFNDLDKLASAALRFSGHATGVYITLNPVHPDLLARAANIVIQSPKHTTADRDILHRNWLPIDFDPIRPSGISASDQERAVTLECVRDCWRWLQREGWPLPLTADSANGYHLLFRIDLVNDDASTHLVEAVLRALAGRYGNGQVDIDIKNFNAVRIWKLYGTLACKGSSTAERPHRIAKLLNIPPTITVVPRELLEQLSKDTASVHRSATSSEDRDTRSWNALREWINQHTLKIKYEGPYQDGYKFVLDICPFNPEHNRGEAAIFQFGYKISFKCLHESCKGKTWEDVLQLLDPEVDIAAESNDGRQS